MMLRYQLRYQLRPPIVLVPRMTNGGDTYLSCASIDRFSLRATTIVGPRPEQHRCWGLLLEYVVYPVPLTV